MAEKLKIKEESQKAESASASNFVSHAPIRAAASSGRGEENSLFLAETVCMRTEESAVTMLVSMFIPEAPE